MLCFTGVYFAMHLKLSLLHVDLRSSLYSPFFLQTIENELRKFEIQQANEQVKMLHSFMPESFLRRGGEEKCTSILC